MAETEKVIYDLVSQVTSGLKQFLFDNGNPALPPRVINVLPKDVPCPIPDDLKQEGLFIAYDIPALVSAFTEDGDVMTEYNRNSGYIAQQNAALIVQRLKDPKNDYSNLVETMRIAAGGATTDANVPHIFPDGITKCLSPDSIKKSFICNKKLYVSGQCPDIVGCDPKLNILDQMNRCIAKSSLPAVVELRKFLENNTDLDPPQPLDPVTPIHPLHPGNPFKPLEPADKPKPTPSADDGVWEKIKDWISKNKNLSIGLGVGLSSLIVLLVLVGLARR